MSMNSGQSPSWASGADRFATMWQDFILLAGRVLIGERRSYQGAEAWLENAGIAVECLDDAASVALMERLQREKPELWREDIGLPPGTETGTPPGRRDGQAGLL